MSRPKALWQVEWTEHFRVGGVRAVERRFTTEGRAAAQIAAIESAPDTTARFGGVWVTTSEIEWAQTNLADAVARVDAEPIENFDDYQEDT